ncbi:hypothetical protein IKP85_00280 [bacterium]|nr:hypothetical protein [bacterium]
MGDNVTFNAAVGASHQRLDGAHYNLAGVSAGISIPIGQKFSIDPSISFGAGSGIRQYNGQIGVSYNASPDLTFSAAAGVTRSSFPVKSVTEIDQYEVGGYAEDSSWEICNDNNLRTEGEFYGLQSQTYTKTSGSGQTVAYGSLGAAYSPNKKFTFSAGVSAGQKYANQGSEAMALAISGRKCTDVTYVTETLDGVDLTYATGQKIEDFSESSSEKKQYNKQSFVAGANAGVEYHINPNLSVGIDATKGFNSNSDDFVGAKLKVKF